MLTNYRKSFGIRFYQLTIINREGEKIPVQFKDGERLYQAVVPTKAKELQGNCEGHMTCGKCHCIFEEQLYDKYEPEDIELDVLERIPDVTATSRLACNTILNKDYDGAVIQMGKYLK